MSLPSGVRPLRCFVPIALSLGLAAAAAGCKTTQPADVTGSLGIAPAGGSEADWRREADAAGANYRERQSDPEAAIRYALTLRNTGERAQAVAVLEQASLRNPRNMAVLGAYGRALADAGKYPQALDVLGRAHTPDQPDWRILSVQGAVLDQMERHEGARRYYESALRIVPDEPSVLSNLGLSYALSRDLQRAEETLRRAAARGGRDPRVRQNLALVVGLQGRFEEAERIARADLGPDDAAANVAYLKQMLAQQQVAAARPDSRRGARTVAARPITPLAAAAPAVTAEPSP
jgi:Flp pilus assembly protein TadD